MVEFNASFNSPNEMNAQFEDDEQFRTGLGEVIEAAGAVRYDREQDLTDEEKTQARENISAASASALTAHTSNSTIHVTSRDKASWNSKYSLPPNGIPASDLEQAVQDALVTPKTVIEAQCSHVTGTTYYFETTERRGDIASIKPTLLRLKWNSANISDTSSFDRYVVGVLSKRPTTSVVQAYIADFGEAGAYLLTSMGDSQPFSFSIRIEKFDAYFAPSTMKQTALRLWSQTFSDAEKTQMRTNIGAASESVLTAHTSDTSAHFTGTEKADIQQAITDLQPFIVYATAITGSEYYTLDKTYNEIVLAVLSGKRVYIDTGEEVFPYTTIVSFAGMTMIIFGATLSSGNNLVTRGVAVAQNVAMRVNYTSGLVTSVNGNDGDVTLDAAQIGAVSTNAVGVAGGVASLDMSGKVPTSELPSIPTQTSDLVNDSGFVNATQAANAAPVQSVNGSTGAVVLTASDVNALPDTTAIPTKTSDLTNDSDFITETAVDTKLEAKADSVGASANYAAKLTASIPYGKVDSSSTSTVYTATVPGITELKDGVCMLLYNGVVTSASGFTINVNGLGAKPSYSNMTLGNPVTPTNPTRDTTIFNINYAFLFVYSETLVSGGCWIGYRGYDANTNTIGYQLRTNNSTMKASDKFYRYRLLFTSADGTKWVPANTSTSTNATSVRTPNTRAIDPFGEIVWYGTTTAIEANANVTAAQLWQEYYGSYTNIGYSFNSTGAAATMTAAQPIYIKCTPQADGSAIIDATTPYTQSLPSSADGKIYIFLGRAVSATLFEITMNHPVYYHDGSGIRVWTGKAVPDGLPAVTSADNGKVLQVVNGVWTPTTIPSANGVNF